MSLCVCVCTIHGIQGGTRKGSLRDLSEHHLAAFITQPIRYNQTSISTFIASISTFNVSISTFNASISTFNASISTFNVSNLSTWTEMVGNCHLHPGTNMIVTLCILTSHLRHCHHQWRHLEDTCQPTFSIHRHHQL